MNERLLYRLELQARDIEAVMSEHGVDAQVTGGNVDGGAVTFQVDEAAGIDAPTRNTLARVLRTLLGVSEVRLTGLGAQLDVMLDDGDRLDLLPLLESDIDLSPAIVALGWSTNDRPLLVNLQDTTWNHIAILGGPSAGKTALLRTAAVALSISSRQSVAQMVFVDPDCVRPEVDSGPGLGALHYLPHALSAILMDLEDVANGLAFLVDECAHRRKHGVRRPVVVVFIDNVDHLLESGGAPVRDALQQLLAEGHESGVQLVMAARPPQQGAEDHFGSLLSRKSILRLVGRVGDAAAARLATGVSDSGAEELLGRGDSMVVREENAIRFQSAFVDRYDLHWCLQSLQRRRPPALLARSTSARPAPGASRTGDHEFEFSFDGTRVSVSMSGERLRVGVD
ncbi:MAG: FtsK/SpoIIIE domain-containing protein [Chloroflexota bacterium]